MTIFLTLLTVITAAFIFLNSLTGSEVSHTKSSAVAEAVRPVIDPDETLPPKTLDALVRKAAHFIEFGILGCQLMGLTLLLAHLKKRRVITMMCTPLFLSLLAAVLDEYIQSLLDRTSMVKDILLDFVGSAAGIILVWAIYEIFRSVRRNHHE